MARTPNIRIRGIRQKLPPGYVIGTPVGGTGGPARLVSVTELAASMAAQGGVPAAAVGPAANTGGGMLPLVNGETVPFISATGEPVLQPTFIITPDNQCIGVPL